MLLRSAVAALASWRELPDQQTALRRFLARTPYRYGVAAVLVLAAAAVRLALLHALAQHGIFTTFYPAVVLTALYCGARAGVLAGLLSGVVADYLFMEPAGSFLVRAPADLLWLGAFWASCVFICWLVGAMKRAQACAQRAETQVQLAAERQQVNALLRRSEERFRRVVENISDAVMVDDAAGRIIFANDQFLALYGWSRDELPNLQLEDYVAPEFRAELRDRHERRVRGEQVPTRFEYQGMRKDGGRIWAEVIVTPVHDEMGRITGTQSCIRDVTERKQAEEALRQSEQRVREHATRLNALLDSTPAIIWIAHDRACRHMSGNQAAYEFCRIPAGNLSKSGPEPERIAHFRVFKAGVELQPHEMPVQRVAATGEPLRDCALEFRFADGAVRSLIGNVIPTHDALGQPDGAIAAFIDITELRRLQSEREALLNSERAARGEAEHASRAKDEFIAMLSHELRNPLNAILGWAYLLRRSRRTAEDVEQALDIIETSGRTLTEMVSDLLDMSRITGGKLRLDVQTLDVQPIVAAAVETVRSTAEANGVRLEVMCAKDLGQVRGDSSRLQQIIWNLLANAVKFTGRGGSVRVAASRIDSQVEISVCDTGQGIDPAFLPHIFERFRQEDASISRAHGGLGLGLSIVRSLAELHGGRVRAESPGKGQGATFSVTLPALAVGDDGRGQSGDGRTEPVTLHCANATLDGIKVVVVDDEPEALDIVKRVLEERYAQVFTAKCASEGMELLQRVRPDVLVSDIGMPGEDGFQFLRRVRALGPECCGATPAVALTAYGGLGDRQRAMVCGYQAYLAKPVEVSRLVATVASLVGRVAYTPAARGSPATDET